MELGGRMLWALLSGPGRRGGTRGWAFSSWQPHLPLAGLLNAKELVSHWTAVFEKRGIPEAQASSEYIVAHVLGAKTFQSLRPELWTQPLTPWQLQCIQELSSRRLQRMPVQYILGEWDFQGLSLKMAPPVFIPRPETEPPLKSHQFHADGGWRLFTCRSVRGLSADTTVSTVALDCLRYVSPNTVGPDCCKHPYSLQECLLQRWREQVKGIERVGPTDQVLLVLDLLPRDRWQMVDKTIVSKVTVSRSVPQPPRQELVEWVLEEVAQSPCAMGTQDGPLILEVGCGSGAISLSLLSQLPQSRVIAVDKGEAAICLTEENAQRLRLLDRIRIVPLDVTLEGSWAHLLPWGPVDLVVSNPPYVFHQDMEQLAPEIRSYEDPLALDGGEEGMDIIIHILALARWILKDSGSIFLEVDPRHPELVGNWLQSQPDLSLDLVAMRRDFCGRPRFLHIQRSGPRRGCPADAWPGPQPARVPG